MDKSYFLVPLVQSEHPYLCEGPAGTAPPQGRDIGPENSENVGRGWINIPGGARLRGRGFCPGLGGARRIPFLGNGGGAPVIGSW